jgi:Nuclease-related domain.
MLRGEEPNPLEAILNYKNAGQFGEYLTEYALGKDNLPGYSRVISNVYLSYKGRTTEIDVVMVHEKGFYIFESKNYSGWIFGRADQQKWTQSLWNGEKHQFYNPIKQNATHCKAMGEFLGIDATKIFSYIVFRIDVH